MEQFYFLAKIERGLTSLSPTKRPT